ncbi:MAG: DUF4252 domain-containing protein [Terracidiphilus sp.]|jgi:hypothetical protein
MKNRIATFILAAAALAVPMLAQAPPSLALLPPQMEKDLAARASDVTEVTLGKNMLDFAAKFMNGNDRDEAAAKQLILGLDGIYVRSYEFDKEGEYSMDEVARIRQAFQTPEWSPIVHTSERKGAETTDVLMKLVNGETRGMFILTAEPKELTIVLILGPIRMDQLQELSGLSGLGDVLGPTGPLGGAQHAPHGNPNSPAKKGGSQ